MTNATTMRIWCGVLVLGVTILAGCAPPAADRPPTYPVSGTVTYKGEPLANANLNFQLTDGSGYAVAKTDTEGKYSLMTFEAGDGAVPGDYQIAITQYEEAGAAVEESEEDYAPPEDVAEDAGGTGAANLLPAKYSNAATSGLAATVTEAGPNVFDFDLTD